MSKVRNARSLDDIAAEIHSIDRKSIFETGKLLEEAKGSCEHGEWLPWLTDNGWSSQTAERRINVFKLVRKFPKLRNLRLAKTTLYVLTEESEEDLPIIIDELAKHATKKKLLKPDEADNIILIALARKEHGDLPDRALFALSDISTDTPWLKQAVETLTQKAPTTNEAAEEIVESIRQAHETHAAETRLTKIKAFYA